MRRLAVAVLAACSVAGCGGQRELDRLRREHVRLQAELQRSLAQDQLAADVQRDGGHIIVAARSAFLGSLIREVSARYFDRVELRLTPALRVHHDEELKVKTIVGALTVGRWSVDLTIEQVRGTLRARTPELRVSGENRLAVAVPVVLEDASGRAQVHFGWDSYSLVNVICQDFAVEETIDGRLLPQRYAVRGEFALKALPRTVVARPLFPRQRIRLRVELSPESWGRIGNALIAQDRPSKCGIALNPETVLSKLEAVGREGFDVELPRGLLRDITLPAAISGSATVEGREIALSVEPHRFRVTTDHTWYSVAVKTAVRRAEGAPAVAPHLVTR
jgi:hypothetical protein